LGAHGLDLYQKALNPGFYYHLMHYRYFTLEQRDHLEQAIREQIAAPTDRAQALERLHTPDYGTCAACGVEMPYVELIESPAATLCPACRAKSS
jgi:RNA polymerase-binding transcription factor DksA